MSYYDIGALREIRKEISSNNNMLVSYNGKSVIDNLPISFTLSGDDFIKCRADIRAQSSREFLPPMESEKYPSKKLPLSDRWSARHFSLEQVFQKLNTKDAHIHEVEDYYDCRTWGEYRRMIVDNNSWPIPDLELTTAHRYAKIPYED
jgi:hypothetical protein